MQWSVIVANLRVIEHEPRLLKAIMRGVVRSYRYALANPGVLADFGAEYFGIERSTMEKSIQREAPDLHADGLIDMAGLDQAIALQRRLGAFAVPMKAEDIVDFRFLPEAPGSLLPA
jgi:ABC-type nitrate/sulfonate/bicarbonate transport system substrate-binding protein